MAFTLVEGSFASPGFMVRCFWMRGNVVAVVEEGEEFRGGSGYC